MNSLTNKIFTRSESVLVQPLESGLAIISSVTDKIIILNVTGTAIWNLFDGSASCSEIVTKVAFQFSTPTDQIMEEVYALIEGLELKNLILEKT